MISRPQIPFTYEDYKTLIASTDQRYDLIVGAPDPLVSAAVSGFELAIADAFAGLPRK